MSERLSHKSHAVVVENRQARCCGNPSHRRFVAVCSCGWESGEAVDRAEAGAAIQGHRIGVIQQALGIKFGVRWEA